MSRGAAARPLIALDIDGVLNPEGMSNARARAAGYRLSLRVLVELLERTFWRRADGARLLELADAFDADLVWATYRGGAFANEHASPQLGLPTLPVIEFADDEYATTWKYRPMLTAASGRALVWFDDEHLWRPAERETFLAARGRAGERTRLVEVPGHEGLTEQNLDEAATFLESLGRCPR